MPQRKVRRLCSAPILGTPIMMCPSKTELQRDLVTDPEEFLHVFEHLVRDEQIDAGVVER